MALVEHQTHGRIIFPDGKPSHILPTITMYTIQLITPSDPVISYIFLLVQKNELNY